MMYEPEEPAGGAGHIYDGGNCQPRLVAEWRGLRSWGIPRRPAALVSAGSYSSLLLIQTSASASSGSFTPPPLEAEVGCDSLPPQSLFIS